MKSFFLIIICLTPKLLFSQTLAPSKQDSVLVKKIFIKTNSSKEKYLSFLKIQKKTRFLKWDEWRDYVLKEKAKEKDTKGLFYLDAWLSSIYANNRDYHKCIEVAYQAYFSNKDIAKDQKTLCNLLNDLENSFLFLNNTIQLAILVKEKIKTCNPKSVNLYNVYARLNFNKDALKNYRNIYLKGKKYENKFTESKHFNNVGYFFERDEQIDSALYYYEKAFKTIKKHKPKNIPEDKYYDFWVGLIRGNIGTCYLMNKKYKKALKLIEFGYAISLRYEREYGFVYDRRKYWYTSGICNTHLKNFKEAKKCIDSLSSKKEWLKVYKLKVAYYTATGQQELLNKALEKIIIIKDSVNSASKVKLLKTAQEINNIDGAIYFQKQKIIKNQESSEKRLVMLIITGNFTVILSILTVRLIITNFKKRKQQKLITTQKDVIEDDLEDKKILLTELHHRVKNNMQMISSMFRLQVAKIKSKEVKVNLSNSLKKVNILSHIHNNLYVNAELNQTNLKDYLKEISSFSSTIEEEFLIEMKYNIQPNIKVHIDQMITLGLIVNELITNSIKHAFPTKKGQIKIAVKKENDKFNFNYSDDGVGFDEKTKKKPIKTMSSGLGLGLLSRLVNQLGAEPQISSANGFSLNFNFINKEDYDK